jgi:hypothetical protein
MERNAITNIGNQLLTFLSRRRKDDSLLNRLFPGLDESQTAEYYLFVKAIKRSMYCYVTLEKLENIWNAIPKTDEEAMFYQIIR